MAKKGKKNSGPDIWDDEELSTPPAQEFGENDQQNEESGAPQEEEESGNDFLNLIRKSKQMKEEKEEVAKQDGPKLLSKKEKEKLKKEAEKQKKKEAAAKKKAQQQEKKQEIKQANKQNAQSKSSESAPSSSQATPEPEEDKPKPAAAAKKGKKVPAGIAALKRQLELKKQLEEEQRLLEEEEENKRLEEEKLAKQQEEEKEQARAAKKEKERLKKEQLKAEGKLLTKKQKEQKRLQEMRRQQLLQASNVKVAGLDKLEKKDETANTTNEKKKVVYTKKKSSKPKTFLENKSHVKSTEKKADGEEEDLVDDWEKLDFEDDEPVADSWETELEKAEEEEEAAAAEEEAAGETVEQIAERERQQEEELQKRLLAEEEARKAKALAVKAARDAEAAEEARKKELTRKSAEKQMRSPICCILGHVDTGKTKLLDKVRQTNVQGGEAGGITQQIGATYFPIDAIKQKTEVMSKYEKQTYDVPGLLIIDTPGHESFTNLRSRGSNLCNIAILVIDIMHGLEQQTLESIRLLRERKAPFIVALNKIDRLYDWKVFPNNSFRDSFDRQSKSVQAEFWNRYEQINVALSEQGLNSELYFQNKNMAKYVSIVPTSAVTGEGVPDLLWLLLELTQKRMSKQLMYLSKVEATILEVKVVEGFGYTIDVVLSNGVLRESDRIVLCGLNGPIATNIRALLTPPPSRELRIKSEYVHHKEVKAALGVKIAANDLEKAVAGSRLIVVGEDDDEEEVMEDVMEDLTGLLDSVDTSGKGVVVQASTLGSLEALLDFLKDMKIPVMSIGLGPVYKRDVMKATTMLDKAPEYAVMLCFDVKVDKEAEQYATEQNIKIFNADIIYHLFDAFTAYQEKLLEARRKEFREHAVLPCVLKTIQIINKRNPMIIGVDVIEGAVRVGTPICAVRRDANGQANIMVLGRVTSLEVNHKSSDSVKKGQTAQGVAMRLDNPSAAQPVWGRHVDESDKLYSLISRKSIDTLKDPAFRDTVAKEDWLLLKKLKPIFDIK